MKISTSQSSVWTTFYPDAEYYKSIRKAGFRYIDYNFYERLGSDDSVYLKPDWEKQVEITLREMETAGVKPVICHAPKGEPMRDEERILRRTMRAAECCAKMGIDRMVYHPGSLPGMTREEYKAFNIAYVNKLMPTLEKTGVMLLLENLGRWDEPYYSRTAEDVLDLIETIDHPLYQACLDTGHLSLGEEAQYKTVCALGSHLKGLHVQDNFGAMPVGMRNGPWRQDLHLPPMTGRVDFDGLMQGLIKIGYTGSFNIELEAPRAYGKENKYAPEPKLRTVSRELAESFYSWVYRIAEYMLGQYGLNEPDAETNRG